MKRKSKRLAKKSVYGIVQILIILESGYRTPIFTYPVIFPELLGRLGILRILPTLNLKKKIKHLLDFISYYLGNSDWWHLSLSQSSLGKLLKLQSRAAIQDRTARSGMFLFKVS